MTQVDPAAQLRFLALIHVHMLIKDGRPYVNLCEDKVTRLLSGIKWLLRKSVMFQVS